MEKPTYNLLLPANDLDECDFFEEALDGLPLSATLRTENDGVKPMEFLTVKASALPDILFPDLNMLLKNGFNCLKEIKLIDRLKYLPVIVFSTSPGLNVANSVYEMGANYYIQKPGNFPN
jgi:CheY-like chemotaxis protein